ncbi:MAG: clostripain-related cysteine peptidase [Planctomycetota bacterium]
MRRASGSVVVGILVVLLLGSARSAPSAPLAKWTVMLYFGGDAPPGQSSLETAMIDRVASLLDPGPPADVNVVALVDRGSGEGPPLRVETGGVTADIDWVGAKLLHLHAGRAVELMDRGATDLGDPATLTEFLRAARAAFPAAHYALAVKGHARPDSSIGADRSLADGTPDALTIEELDRALAGFDAPGRPALDLLVLDGCGSATVDTVGALAVHAGAVVGSADLLFARSVPYARLVASLAGDPEPGAEAAGATCVRSYPEGSALRSNVPLACPPSLVYGTLACVNAKSAARLRAAFDALGREALRVLRGPDPHAVDRLALARTRAFRFSNSTEMHFDAASIADELAAATDDEGLRAAGTHAALVARSAALALRSGDDLAGTCGLSVCWPCQDGSAEYRGCALWSARAWPTFVVAFEDTFVQCASDSPPNDLSTTAVASASRAVVRSVHADGPVRAEPHVGKRTFFAGGSSAHPDARFLVPFASPPLLAGDLAAAEAFQNAWAYGRIVFVGEGVGTDAAATIECPIESVQVLADADFRRAVTCAALTSPLVVTLPNGWSGQVQMRMTLTQRERPTFPFPRPGYERDRWIEPSPPLGAWWIPAEPWVPRVVCAFTGPSDLLTPPTPSPFSDAPKPEGAPPPAAAPHGGAPLPETPRMIVFPDGTRIRTIRRVVDGRGKRLEYGKEIVLRVGRGCVQWQRFDAGDVVTVGHIERLVDRRERSSATLVTVP